MYSQAERPLELCLLIISGSELMNSTFGILSSGIGMGIPQKNVACFSIKDVFINTYHSPETGTDRPHKIAYCRISARGNLLPLFFLKSLKIIFQ